MLWTSLQHTQPRVAEPLSIVHPSWTSPQLFIPSLSTLVSLVWKHVFISVLVRFPVRSQDKPYGICSHKLITVSSQQDVNNLKTGRDSRCASSSSGQTCLGTEPGGFSPSAPPPSTGPSLPAALSLHPQLHTVDVYGHFKPGLSFRYFPYKYHVLAFFPTFR